MLWKLGNIDVLFDKESAEKEEDSTEIKQCNQF